MAVIFDSLTNISKDKIDMISKFEKNVMDES